MLTKIKEFGKTYGNDLFLGALIMLVALISFGLGRLSKIEEGRVPIKIEKSANGASILASGQIAQTGEKGAEKGLVAPNAGSIKGTYVGSKNGTKYHFPWCSGALRIKEENKVWFQTKEEATRAGYTPASNCEGL